MPITKRQKGFTLLEVIIYIALFTLLMGTAFATAYQLIHDSGKLSVKATTQEEGNFVMRKFNWAMNNASGFTISGSELTIERYTGPDVEIKLGSGADAEKILMNNTGSFLPITTDNVQVTELTFSPAPVSGPPGVTVNAKIKTINTSPLDFTITKYIRE